MLPCKISGVLDQIQESSAKQCGIAPSLQAVRHDKCRVAVRIARRELGGEGADDRGQIYSLLVDLDARQAREVEQIFHEVAHAARGVIDAVEVKAAFLVQLTGVK